MPGLPGSLGLGQGLTSVSCAAERGCESVPSWLWASVSTPPFFPSLGTAPGCFSDAPFLWFQGCGYDLEADEAEADPHRGRRGRAGTRYAVAPALPGKGGQLRNPGEPAKVQAGGTLRASVSPSNLWMGRRRQREKLGLGPTGRQGSLCLSLWRIPKCYLQELRGGWRLLSSQRWSP